MRKVERSNAAKPAKQKMESEDNQKESKAGNRRQRVSPSSNSSRLKGLIEWRRIRLGTKMP